MYTGPIVGAHAQYWFQQQQHILHRFSAHRSHTDKERVASNRQSELVPGLARLPGLKQGVRQSSGLNSKRKFGCRPENLPCGLDHD